MPGPEALDLLDLGLGIVRPAREAHDQLDLWKLDRLCRYPPKAASAVSVGEPKPSWTDFSILWASFAISSIDRSRTKCRLRAPRVATTTEAEDPSPEAGGISDSTVTLRPLAPNSFKMAEMYRVA